MIKFIVVLLIGVFSIIALGITGVLFKVWPTYINDHEIRLTDEKKLAIAELLKERKFDPNPKEFYFGAPNESIRLQSEKYVNEIISKAIFSKNTSLKKSEVLYTFKIALPLMDSFDSEEKDQSLTYFGRMLEILDVKNSGELFNVWRYGFPFGWLKNA
jgi:hypothetical protein